MGFASFPLSISTSSKKQINLLWDLIPEPTNVSVNLCNLNDELFAFNSQKVLRLLNFCTKLATWIFQKKIWALF